MTYFSKTEGNVTISNDRALTVVGKCVVTDPCYILGDHWDTLCGLWFSQDAKDAGADDVSVVIIGKARFLVSRTKWGDGSYHVDGAGEFGVDAGLFCIAEISGMEAEGFKVPNVCATTLDVGTAIVAACDGDGAMTLGGRPFVDTGDDAYDEDDNYGEEDDE